MAQTRFEWDEAKNRENQEKHGVSFEVAQYVFADPQRVIAEDLGHSETEQRYYCFGRVGEGILTVGFTYRGQIIRLFGAGYWRKGKRIKGSMKKKIKYTDEPVGPLQVVEDFLPPPEQLVFKEENVRVTISLSKSCVDFFKKEAKKHRTPYQKMIRRLLDLYVAQYK